MKKCKIKKYENTEVYVVLKSNLIYMEEIKMRLKPWFMYSVNIILIVVVVFLNSYVGNELSDYYARSFEIKINFYFILYILFTMSIGVFLGLDSFIKEVNSIGVWKINLPKLLLLGVPSLYFSLAYVFLMKSEILIYPLLPLFRYGIGLSFIRIFQIIFGYVVITSFRKVRRANYVNRLNSVF